MDSNLKTSDRFFQNFALESHVKSIKTDFDWFVVLQNLLICFLSSLITIYTSKDQQGPSI